MVSVLKNSGKHSNQLICGSLKHLAKTFAKLLLPGASACLLYNQFSDDCSNQTCRLQQDSMVLLESNSLCTRSRPAKTLRILIATDWRNNSILSKETADLGSIVSSVEQELKQLELGHSLLMKKCAAHEAVLRPHTSTMTCQTRFGLWRFSIGNPPLARSHQIWLLSLQE